MVHDQGIEAGVSDDTARFIEANRSVWDDWTQKGDSPAFFKLQRFRAGDEVLQPFELEEIGSVKGKSLLHLQCHFGMDTMAWTRRGATATGVDFSEKSIEMGRSLAADLGIDVRLVCSDVYGLPNELDDTFDIVYTSFGVLAWMPDLPRWAAVIDRFLKPGGIFYVAEYHPFPLVFEESDSIYEPTIRHRYFPTQEPQVWSGEEVNESFVVYGWPYTLGDVVSALAGVGLRIEFLHEFPFSESPHIDFLVQARDGTWRLPPDLDGHLPLVFSLKATKPG